MENKNQPTNKQEHKEKKQLSKFFLDDLDKKEDDAVFPDKTLMETNTQQSIFPSCFSTRTRSLAIKSKKAPCIWHIDRGGIIAQTSK